MTEKAALIITGNEIRDGRLKDANQAFLSGSLSSIGFEITRAVTIGDSEEELRATLDWLAPNSSLIVITGGLGPTSDDLTRDAVASYSSRGLIEDERVSALLKKRFQKLGRKFDASNLKQAMFPRDSEQIENPNGTANGFLLRHGEVIIACFPGVPSELRDMWPAFEKELLEDDLLDLQPRNSQTLSLMGVPESVASGTLGRLEIPAGVDLAFTFSFPCVYVTFESSATPLEPTVSEALELLGNDSAYAVDTEPVRLESAFVDMLSQMKISIAGAESCTGGLIGKLISDIPGCSEIFLGSAVTYANDAKREVLGVKQETLESHGAVSAETAIEMALGAANIYQSDMSFSVTGIAGPGGGSEEKPVGLFFVGFYYKCTARAFRFEYPVPSRDRVRSFAAYSVMDLIRRFLGGMQIKKPVLEREAVIST